MRLVWAAANEDRETILTVSQELGFLTGDETADFVNGLFDYLNQLVTLMIDDYFIMISSCGGWIDSRRAIFERRFFRFR